MVNTATAATALLLLAAAGNSLAAIPTTGTYKIAPASASVLNALKACDKACLTEFGLVAKDGKVYMKGNAPTGSDCKCTQIDAPWNDATGLTLTSVKFSETGDEMTGTAKRDAIPAGGSATSSAKPAATPAGNGTVPITGNSTVTSSASSTASATSTPTTGLALRRREIFARAVDSQITFNIGPTGAAKSNIIYLQSSDAVPTGITAAGNKVYVAGAAVLSAGIAAIVAGVIGM
jgi:hypothetical protein